MSNVTFNLYQMWKLTHNYINFCELSVSIKLSVKTPGVRKEPALLYLKEGHVVQYHMYDVRIVFYYTLLRNLLEWNFARTSFIKRWKRRSKLTLS